MKFTNVKSIYAAALIVALGGMSGAYGATNILVNGDFETAGSSNDKPASWNVDSTVTRDSNNAISGSSNLHLVVSGATGAIVANAFSDFSQSIVSGGTTYTLDFFVSGNSSVGFGPGSVLNVFVDFYNSSSGLVDRHLVLGGFTTGNSYVEKTFTVTAPTNAAYAGVFINFVTGAFEAAAGDISIDNVKLLAPTVTPVDYTWAATGSGDWNTASNWSSGSVPNSSSMIAAFDDAITATSTVFTNAPVTVAGLEFGSFKTYAITGSDTLTINNTMSSGGGTIVVNQGNHIINLPMAIQTATEVNTLTNTSLTIGNPLTLNNVMTKTGSGTLTINSMQTFSGVGALQVNDGTVVFGTNIAANLPISQTGGIIKLSNVAGQSISNLSIAGGKTQLATNTAGAVTFNSVAITGSGQLDVTNNKVILKGTTGDAVQALLGSSGITSSSVTNGAYAVGYVTGSDYKGLNDTPTTLASFGGVTVSASDVLVRYTFAGDADLDGKITTFDYLQIDSSYLSGEYANGGATWATGDFNHDGKVDVSDFVLIDAGLYAYTNGGSVALAQIAADTERFGATFASAVDATLAPVPEPASMLLLGLGAVGLLSRRRK